MRLIDADALNLDYEVEMADDWKTAHEIANVVKYAPTVEAIPKEKLDEIVSKLEKELEIAEKEKERCVFQGLPYFDSVKGYVNAIHTAISTVKEVGGMNE